MRNKLRDFVIKFFVCSYGIALLPAGCYYSEFRESNKLIIMAKSIAFRHLNRKRNKIRKKTVSYKIKENKLILGSFVVLLICAMGFMYVSRINNVATKGYEIENYKKKMSELEKEKQKMTVELADLKSIQVLDNENNNFAVVSHKDIAYVTSTSDVVAMK